MKFRPVSGELIVPVLAIAYALFVWWEQKNGVYQADTILYMRMLIVPVALLALFVIAGSLYAARRNARRGGSDPGDAGSDSSKSRSFLRPALLVCAAAGSVLSMDWLGYLIAFPLFVALMLIAMGVRSASRILIITVCTVLVLHIIFVELPGRSFPSGVLSVLTKLS